MADENQATTTFARNQSRPTRSDVQAGVIARTVPGGGRLEGKHGVRGDLAWHRPGATPVLPRIGNPRLIDAIEWQTTRTGRSFSARELDTLAELEARSWNWHELQERRSISIPSWMDAMMPPRRRAWMPFLAVLVAIFREGAAGLLCGHHELAAWLGVSTSTWWRWKNEMVAWGLVSVVQTWKPSEDGISRPRSHAKLHYRLGPAFEREVGLALYEGAGVMPPSIPAAWIGKAGKDSRRRARAARDDARTRNWTTKQLAREPAHEASKEEDARQEKHRPVPDHIYVTQNSERPNPPFDLAVKDSSLRCIHEADLAREPGCVLMREPVERERINDSESWDHYEHGQSVLQPINAILVDDGSLQAEPEHEPPKYGFARERADDPHGEPRPEPDADARDMAPPPAASPEMDAIVGTIAREETLSHPNSMSLADRAAMAALAAEIERSRVEYSTPLIGSRFREPTPPLLRRGGTMFGGPSPRTDSAPTAQKEVGSPPALRRPLLPPAPSPTPPDSLRELPRVISRRVETAEVGRRSADLQTAMQAIADRLPTQSELDRAELKRVAALTKNPFRSPPVDDPLNESESRESQSGVQLVDEWLASQSRESQRRRQAELEDARRKPQRCACPTCRGGIDRVADAACETCRGFGEVIQFAGRFHAIVDDDVD